MYTDRRIRIRFHSHPNKYIQQVQVDRIHQQSLDTGQYLQRNHTGHWAVFTEKPHWTLGSIYRVDTGQYLQRNYTGHGAVFTEKPHWTRGSIYRETTLDTGQYLQRNYTGHGAVFTEKTHWKPQSTFSETI
ncbi:hypothetical protein BsWGS_26827 [Bradybaena similaris]